MASTEVIPLEQAFLCGDEHIGNNPHRCEKCSSHVVSLAWLLAAPEAKAKWAQAAGMVTA